MKPTLLSIFLLLSIDLPAQVDSNRVASYVLANQLEAFLDNLEDESAFEFNALAEHLAAYLEDPLDINQATEQDLTDLLILDDVQITEVLNHRHRLGPFISVFEMQSLSSMDMHTLELVRHFITVNADLNRVQLSIREMLASGKQEIYVRWQRFLQEKRGFKIPIGTESPNYVGDPNQLFLQFRGHYNYKMSYGITLQKDAGEKLWQQDQGIGIDYVSFHAYARDITPKIKYLALGDYSLSLGQGLIMHSGFGNGKSSMVTSIKRGGHFIKPYTSLDESSFLRGIATEVDLGPLDLGVFISRKREDANILDVDTGGERLRVSSLQTTGLHRTQSEIEDKDAVTRTIIGARLARGFGRLSVQANIMQASLAATLEPQFRLYNRFSQGSRLLRNGGFSYSYLWRNLNMFGEVAVSKGSGRAVLQGLLAGLGKHVDLALLYRDFNRSYAGIDPNPFSESARASNERGLYLGTKLSLNARFWLEMYVDYWRHPWLTFRSDAPSVGQEYFFRATYYQKRKLEVYLQYRSEHKPASFQQDMTSIDKSFVGFRKQLRLHVRHHVSKAVELRNRVEMSFVQEKPGAILAGFLIYQDILYKPMQRPISFTGRVAYFDTDGFAARIYAYENDILRSFTIPAYFDEGLRCYFNIRYKLQRTTTAEVRWETTQFYNKQSVGSGNEAIEGNTRSQIKLQIKHQF